MVSPAEKEHNLLKERKKGVILGRLVRVKKEWNKRFSPYEKEQNVPNEGKNRSNSWSGNSSKRKAWNK